MPTTQEMRNQYPELVVGGVDSAWNVISLKPVCDYNAPKIKPVVFLAQGINWPTGRITLHTHFDTAEFFQCLAAVMLHHRYPFREMSGGTLSCRKITGGGKTSPHAHGVASDHNPSVNSYRSTSLGGLIQFGRQTDMSPEMIHDAEAIRTIGGKAVTTWGGRWWNIKDPMHFEPSKCNRGDLRLGINKTTVIGWSAYQTWLGGGPIEEDEMALMKGMTGEAVKWYQTALKSWNSSSLPQFGVDGDYGVETETWVKKFQAVFNLPQSGNVDGITGDLLSAYHPSYKTAAGMTASQVQAIVNTHANQPGSTVHQHSHDEGVTGPAQ